MGERADEINRARRLDDTEAEVYEYNTTASTDDDASPEELRVEIEQTRAEMSVTIDAIQERLNPETLIQQAKEAARDTVENAAQHAKEAVHDATIGKAEQVVRNVTDTAQDVVHSAGDTAAGAGGSIMETIRRNPIPAALTGLGLAWLWMNRESGSKRQSQSFQRRTSYQPTSVPYRQQYTARSGWNQEWNAGQGYPAAPAQEYRAQAYPAASGHEHHGQSPVGETVDRARETAGNLANQAQETASDVAHQARRTAHQATDAVGGAGSSALSVIQQNPIPAALAGISLAYLWMNRSNTSPARSAYYPYSSGSTYGGSTRSGSSSTGVVDKARNATGGAIDQVQSTAGQVTGQVRDTAGQVTDQVMDTAEHLGDDARHYAMQTRYRFEDMLRDNPLVVGAAAVALGALAGLPLPTTQPEQRLMGEARDTLMERAQTTAQETMEKVQHVAEETMGQVQQAAEDVKTTAQQEAREQGLAQ